MPEKKEKAVKKARLDVSKITWKVDDVTAGDWKVVVEGKFTDHWKLFEKFGTFPDGYTVDDIPMPEGWSEALDLFVAAVKGRAQGEG